MIEELVRAFHAVADAPQTRALVLRGSGDVFSTGIDLSDFPEDRRPDVYDLS